MSLKLNVVIHAEEEFDWSAGFYRSNNSVSHGKQLLSFCKKLLNFDLKLVLAMDYVFITSSDGQEFVEEMKREANPKVEFATHLHPWVNPPFENDNDKVNEADSYPGNLSYELEFGKLQTLTDRIEQTTGSRPNTYLAGRYGIGPNSYEILKQQGYQRDLSVTPFANFSHQAGPDFSEKTNSCEIVNSILSIPHTTGYVSRVRAFTNYLNKSHKNLHKFNSSFLGKVLLKLLGVKRVRLSPEGFSFNEMKKLTESLVDLGIKDFVFSFHSPSVKVGLTPYVKTQQELTIFENESVKYCHWFNQSLNAVSEKRV